MAPIIRPFDPMVIPIENIFLAVSEYDFGHFGGSIMFRSLYMHKGRPH